MVTEVDGNRAGMALSTPQRLVRLSSGSGLAVTGLDKVFPDDQLAAG